MPIAPRIRRARWLPLLCLLAACSSASAPPAASPAASPPPAAAAAPAPTPTTGSTPSPAPIPPLRAAAGLAVVASAPGMETVAITAGLAYRATSPANRLLDVYLPPTGDGPWPVVLVVHGSAPASAQLKDSRAFQSWGRLLAASGLVAAVVNWNHPDTTDLAAALAYLRANAAGLKLDPERIAVLLFSGGAAQGLPWALGGEAGSLRAAAAYYGDCGPAVAALESLAPARLPPLLIARGGRDEIIGEDSSARLAALADERGYDVRVATHPEGVHAFDLRNNDDTSREIIAKTIDFLRGALAP